MNSKKEYIGLIGGMGSHATLFAFKKLISLSKGVKDSDFPLVIIDNKSSIPSRIDAILNKTKVDELIFEINESIKRMVDTYKVKKIIITCNTAHYFYEQYSIPDNVELINMFDELAKNLDEKQSYVFLGTVASSELKLIEKFNDKNIKIRYPKDKEQKQIDKIIMKIKKNDFSKQTRKEFESIISNNENEKIIIGCTELSALIDYYEDHFNPICNNIYDSLDFSLKKMLE